ncbi:MAG: diacylglycerol kinase family lipid kinase [Armatimonadetes bacterium]|nr:diacylglycerol kinase family lipid kinase [Armatimonadota bacterium]
MWAVLIANPAARRVETEVPLSQLVEWLAAEGVHADLRVTATAGDGERLAREAIDQGATRIIAAGGDGTLNEVLQALVGRDVELALLPLGTGNVMARSMGLDERDLRQACRVAATGEAKLIDVGRMGPRYFAATAGAGLDAQVALNLDPRWKRHLGRLAYFGEFFRTVMVAEPRTFRVEADGEAITGPMWGVLICNTNEYTWRMRPSAGAREDDGLLDAVLIHRTGFLDLIDLTARMFIEGETAEGHPNATVLRVGRLSIAADPPVPWQVEGDVGGMTPVSVEVVPRSLWLVMGPDDASGRDDGK